MKQLVTFCLAAISVYASIEMQMLSLSLLSSLLASKEEGISSVSLEGNIAHTTQMLQRAFEMRASLSPELGPMQLTGPDPVKGIFVAAGTSVSFTAQASAGQKLYLFFAAGQNALGQPGGRFKVSAATKAGPAPTPTFSGGSVFGSSEVQWLGGKKETVTFTLNNNAKSGEPTLVMTALCTPAGKTRTAFSPQQISAAGAQLAHIVKENEGRFSLPTNEFFIAGTPFKKSIQVNLPSPTKLPALLFAAVEDGESALECFTSSGKTRANQQKGAATLSILQPGEKHRFSARTASGSPQFLLRLLGTEYKG